MPVVYEFVVETLDFYEDCGNDPDIIDTNAFQTLRDAYDYTKSCDEPWRICLRRDVGNDLEGLIERHYAYPDMTGQLPEIFESAMGFQDGSDVPVRFRGMVFPVNVLH